MEAITSERVVLCVMKLHQSLWTNQVQSKPSTPRRLTCARCGAAFDCGLSGACWCADEPIACRCRIRRPKTASARSACGLQQRKPPRGRRVDWGLRLQMLAVGRKYRRPGAADDHRN